MRLRFLSWFLDQVEKGLMRIVTVTSAKPVEYPKIIDSRETVCIWCEAVTSRGEPHKEDCGK